MQQLIVNRIETPIILVLSSGDNIGELSLEENLQKFYAEKGFNAISIYSSKSIMKGNYYIEDIIGVSYGHPIDLVYRFNHQIKSIEYKDKPDLFIIGIPGACMPLSENLHEGFGVLHYVLTRGFFPDYVYLVDYLEVYPEEYYKKVNEFILNRYGFEIDVVLMSNTRVDWMGSTEDKKSVLRIDKSIMVNNMISISNQNSIIPIYGLCDIWDCCYKSLGLLEEYGKELVF